MIIFMGLLLSIGASIGTYFGFGFQNRELYYLTLFIPFIITYFVIYLNVYWLIFLIGIAKYRSKEFVGKVNFYHLYNVRMLSSFVLTINGVSVCRIKNKKWPTEPGLYLFNHVSDYDPWALYKVLGFRYAFVGKIALRRIPMVRCLSSSIGTLYVDNGNEKLNHEMVEHAVEYITQKDTSVIIAPEGTRNFNGQILPFKHGGFHIALLSKCPIYFIAIKGMEKTTNKKAMKRAKVTVELFDEIKPEQYEGKSAGQIALMCEEKYRDYFKQV